MIPDEDGMVDIAPYGMFKVADPRPVVRRFTESPMDPDPHYPFGHLFNADGTVK